MKRIITAAILAACAIQAATITAESFGLHSTPATSVTGTTAWPTFTFGTFRTLASLFFWADENPSSGVYEWDSGATSRTVKLLNRLQAHGVTSVTFNVARTPTWASSAPTDTTCRDWASRPGVCDPPSDLASNGTGTNQHFKDYVTALRDFMAANYPSITLNVEMWNEPNASAAFWKGTLAQLVRMEQDADAILKSGGVRRTNTRLLCPPAGGGGIALGASWLGTYFAAGGGLLCDVIGIHGYINHIGGVIDAPEHVTVGVTAALAAMAAATPPRTQPLWDTEGSYAFNTYLADATAQATWLGRWMITQFSMGVQHIGWYTYDLAAQAELYDVTGGLHAAGAAYGRLATWLIGATPSAACAVTGNVYTCPYTKSGGYSALIAWNSSTTAAYVPAGTWTRYTTLISGTTTTIASPGVSSIALGQEPVLLETAVSAAPTCTTGTGCAKGRVTGGGIVKVNR